MISIFIDPLLKLRIKMARRKKMSVEEELKKIEDAERRIAAEEKTIEEKEDLIRVFEELGLMRWRSYYILTAGAILLLALTFVTALWTMHSQLVDLSAEINQISAELTIIEDMIEAAPAASAPSVDWCPVGTPVEVPSGLMGMDAPGFDMEILGIEDYKGMQMCHAVIIPSSPVGEKERMDLYWDTEGNFEIL